MAEDEIEFNVRDGIPQVGYDVPPWIEVYKHGKLLFAYHVTKHRWVGVDTEDMTEDERQRAVTAAVVLLERHPVNRKQRRAQR